MSSVRNITICHARWWHGVAGATCTAVYISMLPIVLSRRKRKGATLAVEQQEDPPLFKEHPHLEVEGGEVGGSELGLRRPRRFCLLKEPIWGAIFADISLDVEEPTTEGLPPCVYARAEKEE